MPARCKQGDGEKGADARNHAKRRRRGRRHPDEHHGLGSPRWRCVPSGRLGPGKWTSLPSLSTPPNGLGFTCGRPSLGGVYQYDTTAAMAKHMAARDHHPGREPERCKPGLGGRRAGSGGVNVDSELEASAANLVL
jgi:hypothetical protein